MSRLVENVHAFKTNGHAGKDTDQTITFDLDCSEAG